jgi:bifunctional N-acetylglucosamine-1-phosphate-uridyltransferase/glucosamine-1-phosphate-acetyltransferase GlmU-like protein
LIFFFKDYKDKPIYSYIKIKNNQVIEIKEKVKISDNANVGAYCFKKLSLLKKFAELLINEPLDNKVKEYYISSIYNLMLRNNIKISSKEIKDFNCLGTPEQLEVN